MPNPNTIPTLHYQDIQIPDVTLYQQFQQYVAQGNFTQALSLLQTNAQQLQGKAYIANTINTITAGILDLEGRFNTGVNLFLSNLATQYSTLIANMKKAGTWLANVQYTPYNFVIYNQEYYMCIQQPPIGTGPTNTTYWLYLGLRGEQGAPGIDVTMRYDWNNTTTYQPNDLVVYGTNIYVALVANTNVIPGTDEATWLTFLVSTPGQIFIGTTAPEYPVQDTIWFQTQTDPTQATSAVIGQFVRYNEAISDWEPMYPNTIFTWVEGADGFAPTVTIVDLTIEPTDWNNGQYVYAYKNLTANSVVYVLPVSTQTVEQYQLYCALNIAVSETSITLTLDNATPTVALPILIEIQ